MYWIKKNTKNWSNIFSKWIWSMSTNALFNKENIVQPLGIYKDVFEWRFTDGINKN